MHLYSTHARGRKTSENFSNMVLQCQIITEIKAGVERQVEMAQAAKLGQLGCQPGKVNRGKLLVARAGKYRQAGNLFTHRWGQRVK